MRALRTSNFARATWNYVFGPDLQAYWDGEWRQICQSNKTKVKPVP